MPAKGGGEFQVRREWQILRILETAKFPHDRAWFAEHFGISEKTIGRDMDHLQAVGFPIIKTTRDRKDYYQLAAAGRRGVPQARLSLAELTALNLARAHLAELAPEPYYPVLAGAFAKLGTLLSDELVRYCAQIERVAMTHARGVKVPPPSPEVIDQLTRAAVGRNPCDIRYRKVSEKRDTRYTLWPHRILAHKGGLYLLAWHPGWEEFRTLAIERIRAVKPDEKKMFQPRSDRDIEAELTKPFGIFSGQTFPLEVHFSAKVAPFVAERIWWNKREKKTVNPDGSLTYKAEVSGDLEVEAWVLSWGADARIQSPVSVRDRVLIHARALVAREDLMGRNRVPSPFQGER